MTIKENRKIVTLEDAETVLKDFGVDTSNMGIAEIFEQSIKLIKENKNYTFESNVFTVDLY